MLSSIVDQIHNGGRYEEKGICPELIIKKAREAEVKMALDLGLHSGKICTAQEAVATIKPGSQIFAGTACATPRSLLGALESLENAPDDVTIYSFLTDGAMPVKDDRPVTKYRHKCFFVGLDNREAIQDGLAEYIPISLALVPSLIENGRFRIDEAFIQVSAPDRNGYVSLGVSVDITLSAARNAKRIIAEVNPNMPFTFGDSMIHLDQIELLVIHDVPVIEYVHPIIDAVAQQVASYIAGIIEDESTLQIGVGRIPSEALRYLTNRRDLGIHTDVITDVVFDLIRQGIVTGRKKTIHRDKVVASYCLGTKQFYEFIHMNPMFDFHPIEYVCDPLIIARNRRMVSVTQAFAIDLTGEICTDQIGGRFYGGVSTQPEFLRGAARSEGGKPIVCLSSTYGNGESNILPYLLPQEGAGVSRSDIHYVITEYGVAYLFGKSIRERALSLIEIAHPDHRPLLLEEAKRLGYIPVSQTLKSQYAYEIEAERTVTLKNGKTVLLRPARASDGGNITKLFYTLTEDDIYTRFFSKLRAISFTQAQQLCNVNFEDEVAFIAAFGERENEVIAGSACYFLNPSTNIAEVGYMVAKEWQSCGLGTALQNHMRDYAIKKGIRGFKTEVMNDNTRMIALAQHGGGNVTITRSYDTHEITVYFDK